MSIESKHAYRFGYLKSDKWQNVRLEALAREKGLCQICGEESISNDAHHVWYPDNIYETIESHLVILCRPCHEFIHAVRPECKTRDEDQGRREWLIFFNAILTWRGQKLPVFVNADGIKTINPNILIGELNALKTLLQTCKSKVQIGNAFTRIRSLIIKNPLNRQIQ